MSKQKIKALVEEMLEENHRIMKNKIMTAMSSGALDISEWSENHQPMILPKIIVTALLEDGAVQYGCIGSSWEKSMKKEIRNLRRCI